MRAPTKYKLAVNLKTAKVLGLTVSPTLSPTLLGLTVSPTLLASCGPVLRVLD